MKTVRTLRFQSNLSISFWGDCAQCAVHIINRMPLDVLKGKTPYEILFGKKPDYSHLKVFGCLCFVSTLKKDRHKFMQRALKGVFIGYYPRKKGYKVYNLETKTVVVSKDVVFHEHHVPYQYSKQKDGSNITK